MRIYRNIVYIPHVIIENLMEIHSAIDPDTGHIVCHYKPIGLTMIEISEERYPGLRIGDCVTLVAGEKAIAAIASESNPYPISSISSDDYKNGLPIHEFGNVFSLLKEAIDIKIRITKDNKYYIFLLKYSGEEYAVIIEKCSSREEEHDLLRV